MTTAHSQGTAMASQIFSRGRTNGFESIYLGKNAEYGKRALKPRYQVPLLIPASRARRSSEVVCREVAFLTGFQASAGILGLTLSGYSSLSPSLRAPFRFLGVLGASFIRAACRRPREHRGSSCPPAGRFSLTGEKAPGPGLFSFYLSSDSASDGC